MSTPVVYLLKCADGTLYTGWTNNIQKRVEMHNRGRGSRYTRSRLPVHLVYTEEQPDASAARKREYQLRHMPRSVKLELAAAYETNLLKEQAQDI